MGDTSLDEEFEATAFTIGVKAIKQHPDYRIVTNDISILELTEAVSLTDFPNIKPVCLPEPGAKFPGEAIVSGWGTETSGGYLTSYLNEAGWSTLIGRVPFSLCSDWLDHGVASMHGKIL